MITTYIVFFISLWIHGCRSQCAKEKPFYMIDKGCANFNEVCVRKDYPLCKSLLQACAQCPASNLTESTLVNMLTILRDQRNTNTSHFDARLNNFSLEMKSQINSSTFMVIIIIIVISVLVILLVLIEMRWQPFKLRYRNAGASKNKEGTPLITNSRFDEINHQTLANIQNQIQTISKTLSGIAAPSKQKNVDSSTNTSITASINIRGFTNPIKIQINREDNVVKVKQKIYAQMTIMKLDYFKRMVLKLNGTPLDDNQYFADKIRSIEDSLYCDVIENLDTRNIVVVMLRGNICLPEMIQIKKSQPIEDLKIFLSQNINVDVKNLKLFRDSNEIKILDDLKDYDSITVIKMHSEDITIKSIFNNKEVPLTYSNMDSVGNIKKKIAKSLFCSAENVILFCGNKNLKDDVFLFEIDIEQLRQMIYCCLIPWDDSTMTNEFSTGDFSTIYTYINKMTLENLILKKYPWERMKILKENEAILNELETFQITKSHGGFVRLNGVFTDENYFYVTMEKMEESIKDYIAKNHPLSEEIIAKWAKQILIALKYLHDHGIIHRNIKPSSILLDKDRNIKLPSFGLGKYAIWGDKQCWNFEYLDSQSEFSRYIAPEICNNKNYGVHGDVWSFGVTMIEMATGKPPFYSIDKSDAVKVIDITKRIPFKLDKNYSSKLKDFIDKCLIADPKDRATVDDLLNHDFLHSK